MASVSPSLQFATHAAHTAAPEIIESLSCPCTNQECAWENLSSLQSEVPTRLGPGSPSDSQEVAAVITSAFPYCVVDLNAKAYL